MVRMGVHETIGSLCFYEVRVVSLLLKVWGIDAMVQVQAEAW